jgi:AraC family transcriptional activator of pobA
VPRKKQPIPVNPMANEFGSGIAIEKLSIRDLPVGGIEDAKKPHREDGHSFFLLEVGTVQVEIDFQMYTIGPSSVIYMHPDQVHRIITFDNVTLSSLSITNENLNPEYLKLLEEISPARPLVLTEGAFSIISEAVSFSIKLSERKKDKLSHLLLKDSCNALVALVISEYLDKSEVVDKSSRFDTITKGFRELLERNYAKLKRPASYAGLLNISTPYLNECVKNSTGYPVTHHLQQRVILEAKRLLYHSDRSVKEIAGVLGYDDFPYFSRLFTKVTGMTAVAFRNKHPD